MPLSIDTPTIDSATFKYRPTDAARFALSGLAASLALFGLLRLPWIEAHLLLPFTRVQGLLAVRLFGAPTLPIEVTLACSGADATALCLGAILAYPVAWRRAARRRRRRRRADPRLEHVPHRHARTGGRVAGVVQRPSRLLWPAVLTLAIAGYVFVWMRLADRRHTAADNAAAPREPLITGRPQLSRRFIVLTAAFVLLFLAASPLYLESPAVAALAAVIARAAAAILGAAGISANAAANVLWTAHGGFLVTQECVSTPLIPIYLAAVCAYSSTWPRLIGGVLAAGPIFIALGIARLLVVALPEVLVSPLFFVHAFYQLLLGAVVVGIAARWRHGARGALRHALVGLVVGVLFVYLLGPAYTRIVSYPAGAPLDDPQGAIALLPSFQVGLYLALWAAAFVAAGWTRFFAGLAALGLTQAAGLLALHVLATHADVTRARPRRAWLGDGRAGADLCRGGHACPRAPVNSSRSRRWQRWSSWRSPHQCCARRRSACSAWKSSAASTIPSP